jgi:Flp pilus assembly protein TadD
MGKFITVLALPGVILCSTVVSAASQEGAEQIAAGRKLLDQGNVEAALSEFRKAVATDPTNGAAFLNLGQAYERANRADDAIEAYRKSIELAPRNFYAHNNLGVLYDQQDKYDDAVIAFQAALKNDPTNAIAQKNLETARKNKVVLAERNAQISRAQKQIEGKPLEPEPAYQLARLYASHGNKEAATEWLGKAIQLGYKDMAYVKTDPAFVTLRDDREFQLLLLKK